MCMCVLCHATTLSFNLYNALESFLTQSFFFSDKTKKYKYVICIKNIYI